MFFYTMNPKIIGGAGRQEGNFNRVIEIQEFLKNINQKKL